MKQQNLELALRFCAWCTDLEARQRLTEQSVLWNHQETNCNTKTSLKTAPKSEVYTALLKLLITRSVPSVEGKSFLLAGIIGCFLAVMTFRCWNNQRN